MLIILIIAIVLITVILCNRLFKFTLFSSHEEQGTNEAFTVWWDQNAASLRSTFTGSSGFFSWAEDKLIFFAVSYQFFSAKQKPENTKVFLPLLLLTYISYR